MNIELGQLELKELHDLRNRVERAIGDFESRRRKEAVTRLEETAREYGFSLADLTSGAPAKTRRSGGTVPPKYANPEDPAQTWTGRGRQPVWVREHLSSGGKIEDLSI
ncbi:H-NS family nucleoid-associated regulatory protein [Paracoccus pacificus]|uniref:H-NS family nucleoid-associated regulatory protein n=1 Tax=Paracoccus pacificus TaxID=1463598 RepID=A0ABW4R6Y2_9RHOB